MDETLSPEEVVLNQLIKPNDEYWLRNTGVDRKLYWIRLSSEEQMRKVKKLEDSCMNDIRSNIHTLNESDLLDKLSCMGIDVEENESSMLVDEATREDSLIQRKRMDYLRDRLLNAKMILAERTEAKLKQFLDLHDTDYASLTTKQELIDRLTAVGWYGDSQFSDGFVTQLNHDEQNEPMVSAIPAHKFALDIDYKTYKILPEEIERMATRPFREKVEWFHNICDKHRIPWQQGRVFLKLQRETLLADSFDMFAKLKANDMHRYFRFEFVGEYAQDAGGPSREWFELVCDACFDVDSGLFEYSGMDNVCYQINAASGVADEQHLHYFYFLGRVIGKALFDQQVIRAHMTQSLYKHILGWPVTMKDIEFIDPKMFRSLQELETAEDVSEYYLTFTAIMEVFGENQEVLLKPNGAEIEVTNQNLHEYFQLMTKYMMFERTQTQLAWLLKGLHEVIPEVWLSVFDYRELELLLCGLPNINTEDWKSYTLYRGSFKEKGSNHQVIKWFWEMIESSSQDVRAMILQFATGTSRVPVQGFGSLQGNDGNIKLFTIDSGKPNQHNQDNMYPKAHTCFNRIDLPIYSTKTVMIRRFEEALKQGVTGFTEE